MKIAVSTDGDSVSAHFGWCPSFTLVEINEEQLIKKEIIDNPCHYPGFLPQFLRDQGAEYVVAGGIGPQASSLFAESGIKTIVGISGKVDEVIDQILKGTLKGGESLCKPGAGRGYGRWIEQTQIEWNRRWT